MKHFSLLLLNRSWLAVLFFLFLPGVGLSPLASVQPAEKDSQTIQTAPTVPGDLDPTFGNQGLVQADPGGSFAVQLDGKMLVAGSMNGDFALARYNPDGSLDTTFGNDSRVTTDFYGKGDAANTVAIQPDGKILVAGSSVLYTDMYDPSNNSFFALARYYPGGELDNDFGYNGKVLTELSNDWPVDVDCITDLSIQGDGKIVASGRISGYDVDVALVRYLGFLASGNLDPYFGDPETRKVILSPGDSNSTGDMLIQPDGKILITGSLIGKMSRNRSVFLARLYPDGTQDFLISYDFPHGFNEYGDLDSASGLVLQSDGRVVIVGTTDGSINPQGHAYSLLALARFTAEGFLDTSFGDQGNVLLNLPYSSWGADIQIQTDGKLLVSGNIENASGGTDFLLARFSPDGALDPTFGEGGFSRVDAGERDYEGSQIVLLRDGRILLAGRTGTIGYTEEHYVLARLLNDAPALVPRIWFPMLGHP